MAGHRVEVLRPDDAFFLNAEAPGAPQHVGGVAIVDPSAGSGGPVTRADLVDRMRAVVDAGAAPRLRQRVARPWGSLARPAWVDASGFTLDDHVLEHTAAQPGGRRQLEDALEAILSEPLDRARPLWQLWLLNGLAEGRQAGVVKV
ncbi:MAG TPA: wax ester/triacylglycerol synthase domain-containing protein, partial [Acidimicrobiales bacterium]|nr:wax ester/triacylglycerol synthase domain-containing protein [Acidimicrobiales bacterium]